MSNAIASRLNETLKDIRWKSRVVIFFCGALLNRRRLRHTTFIGITGSAGKTTTKDLAAAILERFGPCHRNSITANEHYHIFRTVATAARIHRYCVVEASATRPGYLDRSIQVIRPDISAVTLIAREHYSAFKQLEAIAEEKRKLVAALSPTGVAILNIDDPLVRAIGERHHGRIIWVGKDQRADLRLLSCRSMWPEPLTLELCHSGQTTEVRTRLHGAHLALPVAMAVGIGLAIGATVAEAAVALAEAEGTEARMQVETIDGVTFVRDDWKAPQWSLQAPFDFMRDARASRKIIVIGSISDSPKSPTQRFRHAAREALKAVDLVLLVGTSALEALRAGIGPEDANRSKAFTSVREAAEFLRSELRAGDLVLLKGTAKQDHLARLMFDRRNPVQCWRASCGMPDNCDRCARLYEPSAPLASSTMSQTLTTAESIVIGLGNPGDKYSRTPHNVGYSLVDSLASIESNWASDPDGMIITVDLAGEAITLLKPASDINSVGPVIRRFLHRTGRAIQDCIIVHDDMDLAIGSCRAKRGGGDGGHKGVRSIITALGTDDFRRVRIGVRRSGDAQRALDLVLSDFKAADEALLKNGLSRAKAQLLSMTARTTPATDTAQALDC
ncbi:MAG: aminoacyl-tRNA hydrolase [Burkholderiaceae bacterium]|nr:aminoacyl-tRNA hydrolase [Burkholderiaceae bacterium]